MKILLSYGHDSNAPLIEKIKEYLSKVSEGNHRHEVLVSSIVKKQITNMKKFFISSTFQDMHAERDLIQNIVQPAVNQKLNEQGEYVLFSDLRWGIDTMTDSTERRILDSCSEEMVSLKY